MYVCVETFVYLCTSILKRAIKAWIQTHHSLESGVVCLVVILSDVDRSTRRASISVVIHNDHGLDGCCAQVLGSTCLHHLKRLRRF